MTAENVRAEVPEEFTPQDVQRYRIAWHSYVARRNLMVVLFVAFVPLGILIAKLKMGELASFALLLFWVAVYLTGAWWLTQWKCPRCGKIFADRLWTQRCISCGLGKDEVEAAAGRK